MLVLDPHKRYTIEQIKRHSWMMQEAPRLLPSTGSSDGKNEPNEQIIHLMQNLGIDSGPVREVSSTPIHVHTYMAFQNFIDLPPKNKIHATFHVFICYYSRCGVNIMTTTARFIICFWIICGSTYPYQLRRSKKATILR